ncbi:hypothetical protein [Sphingomonas sp.]|uniref:hypothetical protein n=1 Tax=Sphingomonas sp. TaxID=28214 RepID=UPI0035C80801
MAEEIDFTFAGALADRHALDFYEAGRFQYGAARLMVKLDQFRQNGRFSSRVTYDNNTRTLLRTQQDGSFIISTIAPALIAARDAFIEALISLMWSYVVDRIVKPASSDNLREALQTQRSLIETYNSDIADRAEQNRRTYDLLDDRIARGDRLTEENRELYERLLAEGQRRAYLEGYADVVRRITPDQEARLTSMASPLLKDMGIALRRSATTLKIAANDDFNSRQVAFLNRQMANEIDTLRVDDQTTLILVAIIQYNTETGWGKLRVRGHQGLLSFNVPSDRKGRLQADLLNAMDRRGNHLDTYVECQFVRSLQGILQRAIVLSVRDLDDLEGL